MYRLLGLVAGLGKRARPQSVPPMALLVALCLFGFCWGLGNYLEARYNRNGPLGIEARVLLEHGAPQDYLELTGTFQPSSAMPGEGLYVYLPLVDNGVVTYVRAANNQTVPSQPVKVRGMVAFVGTQLLHRIPDDTPNLRYNRNQVLRYGEKPPSPAWAVLLMVVTVPTGLLLLQVWTMKYIVFRPGGEIRTDCPSQPGSLGVTGSFAGRRFLDLECQLKDFEFTGVADKKEWKLRLHPDSLQKIQAGTLYLGKEERPALRFSCLAVGQRKPQQLVLSFHNESQRHYVYEKLTTCAEKP